MVSDHDKDNATLCRDLVAFKEGECFPIYETSKNYFYFSCFGKIRYVIDQESGCVLGTQFPLMMMDNDFDVQQISTLYDYFNKWHQYIGLFCKKDLTAPYEQTK